MPEEEKEEGDTSFHVFWEADGMEPINPVPC
jgi:hypothetical protein